LKPQERKIPIQIPRIGKTKLKKSYNNCWNATSVFRHCIIGCIPAESICSNTSVVPYYETHQNKPTLEDSDFLFKMIFSKLIIAKIGFEVSFYLGDASLD
jgi:hypothetical protein